MEAALNCSEIPCDWCHTRVLGAVLDAPHRQHMCMVALGAAICQIYHRYELQPLGTMFHVTSKTVSPEAALAPSFEAWLNDVPDDEFVLAPSSNSWPYETGSNADGYMGQDDL